MSRADGVTRRPVSASRLAAEGSTAPSIPAPTSRYHRRSMVDNRESRELIWHDTWTKLNQFRHGPYGLLCLSILAIVIPVLVTPNTLSRVHAIQSIYGGCISPKWLSLTYLISQRFGYGLLACAALLFGGISYYKSWFPLDEEKFRIFRALLYMVLCGSVLVMVNLILYSHILIGTFECSRIGGVISGILGLIVFPIFCQAFSSIYSSIVEFQSPSKIGEM